MLANPMKMFPSVMTNIPIDGNIQTYTGHEELGSPTRILTNNALLSYHQPTVISPLISGLQEPHHQHSHSLLNQMDHATMNINNNSNTFTPSRLHLLSNTSMGISPCGIYNKRDSSIPHVLSNSGKRMV
ncbi:unnamed protein product [Schistosoma margrebowiei]|uniref:Uncharacterized protein n=1 Tax=Schistosoma margrebowiei TaxID=48269 RepID=A0A183M846_9TREM|nr:unnamed protein product [Schistosoma margrebowiei]